MRPLLAIFSVLAIASSTQAALQWNLTLADFRVQPVVLKSIDAAGVHVTPGAGGEEKVIAFGQFLDLSRPVAAGQATGKLVLHLASGDQIGGEPVGVKGNDLVWNSPILGEISLPMKQLVAITHPGGQVPDARRREDIVTLGNGDTLRGIIVDVTGAKVTVQGDAGNNDVPLTSVSQINFASSAGKVTPANGFRIHFDDGSSVTATTLTADGEKANLTLGKDTVRPVNLSQVAMIEQVNGPVSWLSSRPTSESVYIPFMGAPKTNVAKMDHNWTGQDPIRFGSQEFAHGMGVHSYSRLSWTLDGTYAALRTRYAIDTKDANTQADVTIRILLDGKVVYEQPHVRAGTLSPVVLEALDGAKKLTLEVDYGDNLDTQDRVNWIEPALLKQKP
ncbi:MAG TPA: NPCBM/NEW2 domain-containing protein [Tepidisphaeraceae bacterium]|jgi:hypothetical protein|nr:NPCBM/NEW2 domain-containing protein [Tepidisphaeraceae bacterium]